jgi:hypothetical protein
MSVPIREQATQILYDHLWAISAIGAFDIKLREAVDALSLAGLLREELALNLDPKPYRYGNPVLHRVEHPWKGYVFAPRPEYEQNKSKYYPAVSPVATTPNNEDRELQAKALEDAADTYDEPGGHMVCIRSIQRFLRQRAAAIRNGHTP